MPCSSDTARLRSEDVVRKPRVRRAAGGQEEHEEGYGSGRPLHCCVCLALALHLHLHLQTPCDPRAARAGCTQVFRGYANPKPLASLALKPLRGKAFAAAVREKGPADIQAQGSPKLHLWGGLRLCGAYSPKPERAQLLLAQHAAFSATPLEAPGLLIPGLLQGLSVLRCCALSWTASWLGPLRPGWCRGMACVEDAVESRTLAAEA